jgi:hypothetical protein
VKIPDEGLIPKIVKNEWFYLIARLCMVALMSVGLPIATWMINRVITKADEISSAVTAQNVELKILSQSVEFRLRADADMIRDHEARLRFVERGK